MTDSTDEEIIKVDDLIEKIRVFLFLKRTKLKRNELVDIDNDIGDILINDKDESGIFKITNLLFFTREEKICYYHMTACLFLFAKYLNELEHGELKKTLCRYLLKTLELKGNGTYLEKTLFCKRFFRFCLFIDIVKEFRENTFFGNLFVKCFSFLNNVFYSDEKFDLLSKKLKRVKNKIIKTLCQIYNKINESREDDNEKFQWNKRNVTKSENVSESKSDKSDDKFSFLIERYMNDKYNYMFIESFNLFLFTNNVNYENKYIQLFSDWYISHLNENKIYPLKINRSFKYFFRNIKDENVYELLLKQIHRVGEVGIRNSIFFCHYSNLYNKERLYKIFEIVLSEKKKKKVDLYNLLFYIIINKFHFNNDTTYMLNNYLQKKENVNTTKYNDKIVLIRLMKYALFTNEKLDELKQIIMTHQSVLLNFLKNDLNDDVKFEALDLAQTCCTIFKDDKDIYNMFVPAVLGILEKQGKTTEKFSYFCLLYFMHSVFVIDQNEKFLTTLKAHLNLCLTKEILKWDLGICLCIFLLLKERHNVTSCNEILNETLIKSLCNDKELFFIFRMEELKRIPFDHFFFYFYSLLMTFHMFHVEEQNVVSDYLVKFNDNFIENIFFENVENDKIMVIQREQEKEKDKEKEKEKETKQDVKGTVKSGAGGVKKTNISIELLKKSSRAVPKLNLKHIDILNNLLILFFVSYYERKSELFYLKKKKRKNCGNVMIILKSVNQENDWKNEENEKEFRYFYSEFFFRLDTILLNIDTYQIVLYNLFKCLYMYWDDHKLEKVNRYVLRRVVFFLFSFMQKRQMVGHKEGEGGEESKEKEKTIHCYTLLLFCLCHPALFYKGLKKSLSRKKIEKMYICEALKYVNVDLLVQFITKGVSYYNNNLYKKFCFNLLKCLFVLLRMSEDIIANKEKERKDENRNGNGTISDFTDNTTGDDILDYVKENAVINETPIVDFETLKEKLTDLTNKLISMIDEERIKEISQENVEICKCPYGIRYVDRSLYQPTVVTISKNVKRNKHLKNTYGEETAELIQEEMIKTKGTGGVSVGVVGGSGSGNAKQDKNKKAGGKTKEDLEREELEKQDKIRIDVKEIVEKNRYVLKCIKMLSSIKSVFDTQYLNIFIKKVMVLLNNDLTCKYAKKYLDVIISNLVDKSMLHCRSKITNCLHNISKYNQVDESTTALFSSFNMDEKISYTLTLFLFPIAFHTINIVTDKDVALNLLKTLNVLLSVKTDIDDEDAMKCFKITLEKYPDISDEVSSFLKNFNSYLLKTSHIKTLLELCKTENERRTEVILTSLLEYVKSAEGVKEKLEIFHDEYIYLHITIFRNHKNKQSEKVCKEMIRILNIPRVVDYYKLIDQLQIECESYQNIVCATFAKSKKLEMAKAIKKKGWNEQIEKELKVRDLILNITVKHMIYKEFAKLGIIKALHSLAGAYIILNVDDIEFLLNFLVGVCLEHKGDLTKTKELVIKTGSALINAYQSSLLRRKKKILKSSHSRGAYIRKGKGWERLKETKKAKLTSKKRTERDDRGVSKKQNYSRSGKKKDISVSLDATDSSSYEQNYTSTESISENQLSVDDSSVSSASETDYLIEQIKIRDIDSFESEYEELSRGFFKRIYNCLTKHKDKKGSKNKSIVDMAVIVLYSCLATTVKSEALKMLNTLIEKITNEETDNFTQIEISNAIPKFIKILKDDHLEDDEDSFIDEDEREAFGSAKLNNVEKKLEGDDKAGIGHIHNPNGIVISVSKKKKKKKGGKQETGADINNTNSNKQNTNTLIYLTRYDVNLLIEKIFHIIFIRSELKIRKGCALLLGSIIKAHGMMFLKKYHILEKINLNITSEDVLKRQSFYMIYGSLCKLLKCKFEPYVINNFNVLLECYKDNVNNVKVLGINTIENILEDMSVFGVRKVMPQLLKCLKNSCNKHKDLLCYLNSFHAVFLKLIVKDYLSSPSLVELIDLLCDFMIDTNEKVKEVCVKMFYKLEKEIRHEKMRGISKKLVLCIFSPNDNNLIDLFNQISAINFESKLDNISFCLLFSVVRKGISSVNLEVKKKTLQIFFFLINLCENKDLFLIYMNSIFPNLLTLLSDSVADIRYLTSACFGNVAKNVDLNIQLYYIQHLFHIVVNEDETIEKKGFCLCLADILANCPYNVSKKFIMKIVDLIDVREYVEMKKKYVNDMNQLQKKKGLTKKWKQRHYRGSDSETTSSDQEEGTYRKGKVRGSFEEQEEEDEGEEGEEEEEENDEEDDYYYHLSDESYESDMEEEIKNRNEERRFSTSESETRRHSKYRKKSKKKRKKDRYNSDDSSYDSSDDNSDDSSYDNSDDSSYDSSDDTSDSEASDSSSDDDSDSDEYTDSSSSSESESETESEDYLKYGKDKSKTGNAESSDSSARRYKRKLKYLNGSYLIKKNKKGKYVVKIKKNLKNWKLRYNKKGIKTVKSKEGLLTLFIYLPQYEGTNTEVFLKNIFKKLMMCLSDTNDTIRNVTLKACKVLISVYAKHNTSLILKNIENYIFDKYWRLRMNCVSLLEILIERNFQLNKEETNPLMLNKVHELFYFILSLIYIMKNDKNENVKHIANGVYKNYISRKILKDIWPVLVKKITQNLSSTNELQQQISASALGDLVNKIEVQLLESILNNMMVEYKNTKSLAIKKGISLGYFEIFSSNRFFHIMINNMSQIIYMIKDLARHKSSYKNAEMLCVILRRVDMSVLSPNIKGLIGQVLTPVRKTLRDLDMNQKINCRCIRIIMDVQCELVVSFILKEALSIPFTIAKLKLLSVLSFSNIGNCKSLFRKLVRLFVSLIYYNSTKRIVEKEEEMDTKDQAKDRTKNRTKNQINERTNDSINDVSTLINGTINYNIEEGFGKDETLADTLIEMASKTLMYMTDIVKCLNDFLKGIKGKNLDVFMEILFNELRHFSCTVNLSFHCICTYEMNEKKINLLKNFSAVRDKNKLVQLSVLETQESYGTYREILLTILRDLFEIEEEPICGYWDKKSILGNTKNIKQRKHSKSKDIGKADCIENRIEKFLTMERIINYLNELSDYTFVDINKNVLEISSCIFIHLIGVLKKRDIRNSSINIFNTIIDKYYESSSNTKYIAEDIYEIVGLNLSKNLFSCLITICTNVITTSTNFFLKIKGIDVTRKLFAYTNSEISVPFILKISGILIRLLTNKYSEQSKNLIFHTFEILIKKGSNVIRPLIPQLQTCIIKSLGNEELKKQTIRIINTIADKKLTKTDLLINDLLNNINIVSSVSASVTILTILSNMLNTPDIVIGTVINKLLTSVKTLMKNSNKEICCYASKIYIQLVFQHLENKKQHLEAIFSNKSILQVGSCHFMIHMSEMKNCYEILKKEECWNFYKDFFINLLEREEEHTQNVCIEIFYNFTNTKNVETISEVFGFLGSLKLPSLVLTSVEIHTLYFKAVKNIFKLCPDIYKTREQLFISIIKNIRAAIFSNIPAFKSMGENCAIYVLELRNEGKFQTKSELLKEKMEKTQYSQLIEHIKGSLLKKSLMSNDSDEDIRLNSD